MQTTKKQLFIAGVAIVIVIAAIMLLKSCGKSEDQKLSTSYGKATPPAKSPDVQEQPIDNKTEDLRRVVACAVVGLAVICARVPGEVLRPFSSGLMRGCAGTNRHHLRATRVLQINKIFNTRNCGYPGTRLLKDVGKVGY